MPPGAILMLIFQIFSASFRVTGSSQVLRERRSHVAAILHLFIQAGTLSLAEATNAFGVLVAESFDLIASQ